MKTSRLSSIRSQLRPWFRPGDWPILVKILVSLVTITGAAFLVVTYINARTLQGGLRDRVGTEFENLARAEMNHVVDILSEQLSVLRSVTLIDQVRETAEEVNAQYVGGAEAIQQRLIALDNQWRTSAGDSQLIRSVIDPQDNELASQLREYLLSFPDHVEIFITDAYGGLLSSTTLTPDYYQADEDWWQAAYNDGHGAMYIGAPEFDQTTGEYTLIVSAPIRSADGEVIGVARTVVSMNAIQRTVNSIAFGETGNATLINPDGLALADPHVEHVNTQMPISWIAPEHIHIADIHSYEGSDEEGNPSILGHAVITLVDVEDEEEAAAIHALEWILYVHQTQVEAFAPVTEAVATSLAVAGISGIMAVGLIVLVVRGITNPIFHLVEVARQMGSGDLDARAEVKRNDETGELAGAFNRLAGEVTKMVRTLEYSVDERTRGLQAAAEVSRATTSLLDMDELVPQVVQLVLERFRLYYVGLFMVDENREYAMLRAGTGEAGKMMMQGGHKLAVGSDSMIGQCIARDEARIALDVGEEAVRFVNPFLPDTRSEMALPLRSRGRVVGAMSIQSSREAAFSDADIAVMQTMADQVAVAIDNAALFAQTQEALSEMRAIQRRYLTRAWSEYVRGAEATMYESTTDTTDSLADLASPGIRQAVEKEQPVVLGGNGSDEAPLTLVTPIILREAVIGTMGIQAPEGSQDWDEDEIELVRAVAERVALAADNLRLIDETQRRAAREQLTREVADSIRASVTVEEAIQRAVNAMGGALGATRALARLSLPNAFSETEDDTTGLALADGNEGDQDV